MDEARGGRRGGRRTRAKGRDGKGWIAARRGSETEKASEKENVLSLSLSHPLCLSPRGGERGWIKASTRGRNKERTKKVEEVGGGGWVPWSALIGSTWSDEKFNHPPIPTRPNSSSSSSCTVPPPLRSLPRSRSILLSFSPLLYPHRPPLLRRLDSHQMNLPRVYAPVSARFYGP